MHNCQTLILAFIGTFAFCLDSSIGADRGHGLVSSTPASVWQEALMTGNGKMGVLVFGDPNDDRIIFNHERLYEPLAEVPQAPPKVASVMPELRRLLLEGQYEKARKVFAEAAWAAGFSELQWTDPYHPAMAMLISQSREGALADYSRSVDFRTGEVSVKWRDDQGAFDRRCFVSRPDDVIVQHFRSNDGMDVNATVQLVNQDQRELSEQSASYHPPQIEVAQDSLSYSCKYRRSGRAYVAVTRVVAPSIAKSADLPGSLQVSGNEVLLLTRIVSVEDAAELATTETQVRGVLDALPTDYESLLAAHSSVHGEIYDRMQIDLGGRNMRDASTEELIAAQKASPDCIVPALLEKVFNMGRYSFLCSSGEWPPNLMGIFNGEWRPKWSGDFTLDANLNLQIAAASIGNMPEGVDSYTRLIEGIADDWRVNAKNLYGCRGFVAGTRTDGRHNLHTHHELGAFPGFFWTAGAEWLVMPIYEHYQVTGNRQFAEDRLLPLMKGVVEFYEDFLVERDSAGKLVFVPSYSPENTPKNTGCPVAINATMDIACAREACTNLITLCRELKIEPDTIERCEALLSQLPPYFVNDDGALQEWAWPTIEDRYNHRHVSHLYPVWPGQEINPEDTPELFAAAKIAAAKRGRGNGSAHGLAHMALIGARLKDAELVHGNLLFMLSKDYLLPSLFTYHNPNRIYNADMLHSLPAVVIEMLVNSKPGEIELLPALSEKLSKGEISGVCCRCRATIDRLSWDMSARSVKVTLTSQIAQKITLRLRRGVESCKNSEGGTFYLDDRESCKIELQPGAPLQLTIKLAGS